jgi:hypothetical protein
MRRNELYLAVFPLIHLTPVGAIGFGLTEDVMTLVPSREFATEFFPDQVDGFVATFENRRQYLSGGRIKGFEIKKEPTDEGRVIVRVVQIVD